MAEKVEKFGGKAAYEKIFAKEVNDQEYEGLGKSGDWKEPTKDANGNLVYDPTPVNGAHSASDIGALESIKAMANGVANVMNYIGFAKAIAGRGGETTKYTYITRDSQGRIIDRGTMTKTQINGEVNIPIPGSGETVGYGLTRTTTETKSNMTGAATKSKSITRKFIYKGVGVGTEQGE